VTTRSPDLTLLPTANLLPPLDELREWAQGTKFEPDDDAGPFVARDMLPEYEPLGDVIGSRRARAVQGNVAGLQRIAMEVLSEPRLSDPDLLYVERVFKAMLDRLSEQHGIRNPDYDNLLDAFDRAVELSALAVARAWLRERKSLPIAIE
jgi:hypothetical protein